MAATNPKTDSALDVPSATNPIVVDLGKKSRKDIRRLRRGRPGKLIDQVSNLMQELKAAGTISDSAQPVVVVVRQRTRGGLRGLRALRGRGLPWFS